MLAQLVAPEPHVATEASIAAIQARTSHHNAAVDRLSRWTRRAVAAPAALFLTVGQGTCRGLGDTRTVLGIALGMNAFHLALDPLFIYAAGWGVSGAAAATVVAEVGAAAAYGVCIWQRRDVLGVHDLQLVRSDNLARCVVPFKRECISMLGDAQFTQCGHGEAARLWAHGGFYAAVRRAGSLPRVLLFLSCRNGLHAGLMPLPPMSLARAGKDFLPFLQAGSAVLARTTLLLGAKTIATAVATRCVSRHCVSVNLVQIAQMLDLP